MKLSKILLTCAMTCLPAAAVQAHLTSFGWTDNGNGTVTLWGEHWHGNLTSAYTANGGITITSATDASVNYTVQWTGVQNNTDRDDMVADGTLTGYVANQNGGAKYHDWLITDALVIGNGDWLFFTGTNCCVDTMTSPVAVTLTGITSVNPGTGPGGVTPVPEPSAAALLGMGLLGLGFAGLRKKKA